MNKIPEKKKSCWTLWTMSNLKQIFSRDSFPNESINGDYGTAPATTGLLIMQKYEYLDNHISSKLQTVKNKNICL